VCARQVTRPAHCGARPPPARPGGPQGLALGTCGLLRHVRRCKGSSWATALFPLHRPGRLQCKLASAGRLPICTGAAGDSAGVDKSCLGTGARATGQPTRPSLAAIPKWASSFRPRPWWERGRVDGSVHEWDTALACGASTPLAQRRQAFSAVWGSLLDSRSACSIRVLLIADESRMSAASLHCSSKLLLRKDQLPAPSHLKCAHELVHAVP
jgi:hypothetical protein